MRRRLARLLVVVAAAAVAVPLAVVPPAHAAAGALWLPTQAGGTGFADFAVASDTVRGELVAFASSEYAASARTLTFDGAGWRARASAAVAPASRLQTAMAFDAARGVTVLFGGRGRTADYDDTWTWDGAAWTQLSPAARPPARSGAAMTYDEARQVVLLFGGYVRATNSYLDDLWQWDGSTWTQLTPAGNKPAARAYAAMAWSGRTVLFGGGDGRPFNDCWIFDGTVWSGGGCGSLIASRQDATMAADAYSGTLVLWGGHDNAGRQYTDTWTGQTTSWGTVDFRRSDAPNAPPYAKGARLGYLPRQGRMVLVTSSSTWFYDTLLND